VLAALRRTGAHLREQRIVILGAGAAGVGIARLLRSAFASSGLSGADLTRAIAVLDSRGLVVADREIRDEYKRELAWPGDLASSVGVGAGTDRSLLPVVTAFEPTILIGTSGQAGAFEEATIRAMAASCERPIIFPLSNPTAHSEATPSDLLDWTDGRALIATGSPFDPVERAGVTHRIGQGNNVFIFPGVGLGALVARAREVTDGMFEVAANTLATQVGEDDLDAGMLFPPVTALRDTAARIAIATVREARAAGVGREMSDDEIREEVAAAMWVPAYPSLVPL
jgi:malic enzyme